MHATNILSQLSYFAAITLGRRRFRSSFSRFSFRKSVAMIAFVGIGAAVFAVWLYLGLLETILVFVTLSFLYIVVFKSRWCFVALTTAPRDIRYS